MTNNTPTKISIVPIQNDKPIRSPNSSHPKKAPTIGCKKKNNPPFEASSIWSPRFRSKTTGTSFSNSRYHQLSTHVQNIHSII